VLRLWIAPWEDADGDLHEASVVHVLVDTGRWLVERVIPANRQRVDAVRPPVPSTAPASAPASAGEPVPSAEAGSDRLPPRTGLLPGSGATQEP
jgi:conjugal transfer pilus assembly protein TraV